MSRDRGSALFPEATSRGRAQVAGPMRWAVPRPPADSRLPPRTAAGYGTFSGPSSVSSAPGTGPPLLYIQASQSYAANVAAGLGRRGLKKCRVSGLIHGSLNRTVHAATGPVGQLWLRVTRVAGHVLVHRTAVHGVCVSCAY